MALLYQLQESERWSADKLLEAQREQFDELLGHARASVPYYARSLADCTSAAPGTPGWLNLPLLTREHVQQHAAELRSDSLPSAHGPTFESSTSGSTGQPVVVTRTALLQLLWEAITLREHSWFRRDASRNLAIIRVFGQSGALKEGRRLNGWGVPFDLLWRCGSRFALDMRADVSAQAAWFTTMRPDYLLTYPTNLEALLAHIEPGSMALREILCVGEVVSPQLRERCTAVFGAPLTSNYSSQELGYLALPCPDCNQLHAQAESVYLEVLDEDGNPCAPGTVGRVVVTDLHNFAMPLIRYVVGDYAEAGTPCTGGRGLPSLRRVLGRRRNMVILPDGRRNWPVTGFARFPEVAPISQYQLIQRTREDIEVRLVATKVLGRDEFRGLANIIAQSLGHPFRFQFRQFQGPLPKARSGKFEEFVCLVQ